MTIQRRILILIAVLATVASNLLHWPWAVTVALGIATIAVIFWPSGKDKA